MVIDCCISNHPKVSGIKQKNHLLLSLTVLGVDWTPLGGSHVDSLLWLHSESLAAGVMKASPLMCLAPGLERLRQQGLEQLGLLENSSLSLCGLFT